MATDLQKQQFKTAVEVRKLEIELFWKRSLFFWGFIAAAFTGLLALIDKHETISFLVSGFGFVC